MEFYEGRKSLTLQKYCMTEAEASSFYLDSQDHGYLTRAEFQEVRLRREEQVHGYPS